VRGGWRAQKAQKSRRRNFACLQQVSKKRGRTSATRPDDRQGWGVVAYLHGDGVSVFFSPLFLLICPRQLGSLRFGFVHSVRFCPVHLVSFLPLAAPAYPRLSRRIFFFLLAQLQLHSIYPTLSHPILFYPIPHPTSTPGYRALRVCPLVAYFSFVYVVSRRNAMQYGIGT
jgi:hypothetical protein